MLIEIRVFVEIPFFMRCCAGKILIGNCDTYSSLDCRSKSEVCAAVLWFAVRKQSGAAVRYPAFDGVVESININILILVAAESEVKTEIAVVVVSNPFAILILRKHL